MKTLPFRATDEFPRLGRVEQLVLRGDGLTTTSLEILTGEQISVEVAGHWMMAVPEPTDALTHESRLYESSLYESSLYDNDSPDPGEYLALARQHLDARPGERLLVRDVLLIGPGRTVHGSAEVVARLDELPGPVASALASTEQPIGRLLRDHGVHVARELRSWGLVPAGVRAPRLGASLTATSRVSGRTYVMRLVSTSTPLAVLTERFAPHVFDAPL